MPKKNPKLQNHRGQTRLPLDGQRSVVADDIDTDFRFNLSVRAETVDEENRSVEVVLATENRVIVQDPRTRQIFEEILLMDGMVPTDHLPMIDNHGIRNLDDEFGSVRNIRIVNRKLQCRFFFADLRELENDEQAKRVERAWLKVKQGHHKGVSVGYRVLRALVIEPGTSRKVNGKIYTAGDLPLRVALRWQPREGSLTVVQADKASHIRSDLEATRMNEKLLKHLQGQGLRSDATVGEAWDFMSKLDGQQRSTAEQLIAATDQVPDTFVRSEVTDVTDPNTASGTPPSDGQRNEPPADQTPGDQTPETVLTDLQRTAVDNLVADQVRSERTRVGEINRLFEGIDNAPLMARAIEENWSPHQTAAELLPLVRGQRSESVGADSGHIGIHSVRAADQNSLACALMLREGVALDHPVFESDYAVRSIPQELRQSINDDQRQQTMEIAHRHETMSLVDICRAGLQIDGMQVPHERGAMIRAAVSSSAVQAIFTTNVSARVLASFMDADDTTRLWTTEEDVPNFQSNERITMGKYGALTKHARGGTADHMDTDASMEQYKIARYSGQTFTDEQDIIDDRLGAMNAVTPEDMGLAARQLRPDLCYAELLANSTLNATGAALFTVGQNNLFSGGGDALSLAALGIGLTAMQRQRIKTRILNLALKYVLVPADLALLLDQILHSVEIREAAAAQGTKSYLHGKGLIGIADDRLGTAGVTHPVTGVHYSGTAVNYFGAAQPGRNGAKTIVVGYLRGTGRAPQINSFVKNDGTWGIGQAVKMDIGAKPLDFRGLQKHVGA